MQGIIDTHCHLDHPIFAKDFGRVLGEAQRAGVVRFLIPSTTSKSWERVLRICSIDKRCFAALGLHPLFLQKEVLEDEINLLGEYLYNFFDERKIIAIGEVGLDFYNGREHESLQRQIFTVQIRLAKEFNLPLLLHIRKAHDEAISLLREENFFSRGRGGIVHAFSGSMQQAEQYMKNGFLFGVGGSITYPRAKKLQRLVKSLPQDSIVLETDAPDMSPAGCPQGKNSPAYLSDIIQSLAKLRGEDTCEIAQYTTSNATRILQLSYSL